MSRIKILVVEDELLVSMNICNILEDLEYDVLKPVSNFEDAVKSLEKDDPDIALLDIDLKNDKSGIDVARHIKAKSDIPFIFLTSKSDPRTVDEVKTLNPPAYLVKPFQQEDLYTSIEMALYNYASFKKEKHQDDFTDVIIKDAFFVKGTNLFHKVKFSEILFAKSEHVYVEIYTQSGKTHLIRSSMSSFLESMPKNFFRVQRSYAINLDHLDSINNLYVLIQDHKIPIGKNYRDILMQQIKIK